jgi:hypothetical protein
LGRDLAVAACAATIEAAPGHEHAALFISSSKGERRCRRLGVRECTTFAPPLGAASLATRALRDAMWRMGTIELVIAWGRELEEVVSRAAPPRSARATVDLARGVIDVVVPDRFGFTIAAATLSARLGLPRRARAEDPGRRVVLLSDPPERADVSTFAVVLGLLSVGGIEAQGVAPRDGHGVERALRHVSEGGVLKALTLTKVPLVRLIPSARAVVIGLCRALTPPDDDHGVKLPEPDFSDAALAHLALDRGVPVVAPRAARLEPIAATRGGITLVDDPTPVAMARGLEAALRAEVVASVETSEATLAEGVARIIEQVGRRLAPPPPTFASSESSREVAT